MSLTAALPFERHELPAGGSCSQIIAALGPREGRVRFGCSLSAREE